jgi:hypothetical protein
MIPIKPREATAVVNALMGGVVPRVGLQYITVGRDLEVAAILKLLEDVKNGQSVMKFWIGDYGSGKSFILHLLNTLALKERFVTATADFTPERRLYSNDRKGVATYSILIESLATIAKPEGGALETLLEKWIEQVLLQVSAESGKSISELRDEANLPLVERAVQKTLAELSDVGSFDFGQVILKYYEAYVKDDAGLRQRALRWLRGEYTTKTEARADLNVRDIISDQNYYDMLRNFTKFFVSIGYSGFVINLDEAINLFKISNSSMREKNYEKILSMYNNCLQGASSNMLFNVAGTVDFLEDKRRGLFSYEALRSRLEGNRFETTKMRDLSQPVIKLTPLNNNEIFVLLKKLNEVFNVNFSTNIQISDTEIQSFMQHLFNQPGAGEFLTPREVIREFLNALSIIRQNPAADRTAIFGAVSVKPSAEYVAATTVEEF